MGAIPPAPIEANYKDLDLDFDGTDVKSFLEAYETKAKREGASEYDMAWQMAFFIRSDEVFEVIKTFDGFKHRRWSDLKASMLVYWGQDETPRFTLQDMDDLLESWSAKEYIYWPRDYPTFWQSFEPIVSYLLRNECWDSQDTQDLCSQAFFRVCRRSLAARFPPSAKENKAWVFDCRAATEFIDDDTDTELGSSEQSIEDPNHTDAASTPQSSCSSPVASAPSIESYSSALAQEGHKDFNSEDKDSKLYLSEKSIKASNHTEVLVPSNELLSSRPIGLSSAEELTRAAPELEEENWSAIPKSSEQSTEVFQSPSPSDFHPEVVEKMEARSGCASASESALNSTVRRPLRCYYCHCDGHRFRRCPDLRRDKKATLVEQKGSSFFLPSSSPIPFNPSRPIRTVVESFQVSSPSHHPWYGPYKAHRGSLKPGYPPVLSTSSQAPPLPRSRPYHPIRKPPSQSKFQPSVLFSSPRVVGSAKAVDTVLRKIANVLVPGLSVSKLATMSPVAVEHRKKQSQHCSSRSSSFSFACPHQDRVAPSPDPVFKVAPTRQRRPKAENLAASSNLENLRDEVKLCPSPPDLRSSRPLRQMAEPLISLRDEVKLSPDPSLSSVPDSEPSSCLHQTVERLIPSSTSLREEVKVSLNSSPSLTSDSESIGQLRPTTEPLVSFPICLSDEATLSSRPLSHSLDPTPTSKYRSSSFIFPQSSSNPQGDRSQSSQSSDPTNSWASSPSPIRLRNEDKLPSALISDPLRNENKLSSVESCLRNEGKLGSLWGISDQK
ncbi:hypothetical protein PTTG_25406 [Puccinia triticina 1-1 BBBD Race 1]|uniref:Uncharacterized protein n=1 Tax=Puccinia triticina (isolate 1-1 / race 1 (BBBD)) TaxID=630390 RepID=A0A180H3G2_PUCT1|nr:hypothetical protein PTTG_25406 [Puccinia triticina 1-1 BBBD Race 1]